MTTVHKRKNAKDFLSDFLKVAPLSHALWRSVEALAFERVKLIPPVLDLGCGFGEFAGVVFGQVETGVDINTEDLKKAMQGQKYKRVKWADARKLPFKNSSYNSVISVSVLEHIPQAEKVIHEAYRVLKKGGIFVFSVVTKDLYKGLLGPRIFGDSYWNLHCKAFNHVYLKSKNWWVRELMKANFEIIKQEGTISSALLKIYEIFLVTAFPSQLWKLFFGKRLMVSIGLRSKLLPLIFSRFVRIDKNSTINIFFMVRKK